MPENEINHVSKLNRHSIYDSLQQTYTVKNKGDESALDNKKYLFYKLCACREINTTTIVFH